MILDADKRAEKGIPSSAGYISKHNTNKSARVSFQTDTQMPSISIHLLRPDCKWDDKTGPISYTAFSNSLATKPVPHKGKFSGKAAIGMAVYDGGKEDGVHQYIRRSFQNKRYENLTERADSRI